MGTSDHFKFLTSRDQSQPAPLVALFTDLNLSCNSLSMAIMEQLLITASPSEASPRTVVPGLSLRSNASLKQLMPCKFLINRHPILSVFWVLTLLSVFPLWRDNLSLTCTLVLHQRTILIRPTRKGTVCPPHQFYKRYYLFVRCCMGGPHQCILTSVEGLSDMLTSLLVLHKAVPLALL